MLTATYFGTTGISDGNVEARQAVSDTQSTINAADTPKTSGCIKMTVMDSVKSAARAAEMFGISTLSSTIHHTVLRGDGVKPSEASSLDGFS